MHLVILFFCIITISLANPLLLRSLLLNKLKRILVDVHGAHSTGVASAPAVIVHTRLPTHDVHGHSVSATSAGGLYNPQAHSTGAQSGHLGQQISCYGAGWQNFGVAGAGASSSSGHSTGSLYTHGGNHNVAVSEHHFPVVSSYVCSTCGDPASAAMSGWNLNGVNTNAHNAQPPHSVASSYNEWPKI